MINFRAATEGDKELHRMMMNIKETYYFYARRGKKMFFLNEKGVKCVLTFNSDPPKLKKGTILITK